jgi:hypothetical protein
MDRQPAGSDGNALVLGAVLLRSLVQSISGHRSEPLTNFAGPI